MSALKKIQQMINSPIETIRQVVRYIAKPAIRIFSPTDDEYPDTGVQPFEGDPAKE
ncbi:MAG: isochorismate synthase [Cyanothece sp. SIO1E1]|nr:isochorismate synthase [Cyanothece sp. SIO1E1]